MAGLTAYEADVLLARALVELADGITDGPGMAHARSMVAMADARLSKDPSALGQPKREQKAPNPLQDVLTNRVLDGLEQPPTPRQAPTLPGTRRWREARERGRR
jgi:hypothetical protein